MTPETPPESGARTPRLFYVGGAVLLVVVAGLVLFVAGQRREGDVAAGNPDREQGPVVEAAPGIATLYFVAEDGMALVGHDQELPIDAGTDGLVRARLIVEQLLAEPPLPYVSPFPPGTELRAVYLAPGGDAFVDLNLEVTRGHGGGSLDELFTVYALVNALTVNVPEISAVQILIEGREVDTLAGHVDLRRPLERNLKWVAGQTNESALESTAPDASAATERAEEDEN